MAGFLIRRFLHAMAVVVIATSLGFVILHFVQGDALGASTEHSGRSAEARDLLRHRQGLDQSVTRQYVTYVGKLFKGDLGHSLSNGQPIAPTLRTALANSLMLSGTGLVLAVLFGLAVGTLEGWRPRSSIGRMLGRTLTGFYAIPEFIVAIALIGLLSYRLGWFPANGTMDPMLSVMGSSAEQFRSRVWHLVLPSMTLALGWGAGVARQQKVALLEIAAEHFVRTARSKGLSERLVFFQHAFRPSLPAVVVVVGLMLPVIVGGAVVVETLFAWPGIGSMMLHAISVRDYPLVSGAIVLIGLVVSAASLLTDIVLSLLDPRRRAVSS